MNRFIFLKIFSVVVFTLIINSYTFDHLGAKGVKTSYKRYSIFKVKDADILCEPYTVDKDDWLYKIFRKKGEISEKDFPYFLMVFKKINPEISNIDAIEPGIHILIPLKKVRKKDYDQSTPGTVDVPVIEFSTMNEDLELEPFLKKHKIKQGDNISSLIDKDFLEKGGRISEEGLKAFQMANPNIKNINIVYEGDDIYLPDPSIKTQPWFQSFLTGKTQPDENSETMDKTEEKRIDDYQLVQLKKYSSLIGGTLLSRGKMYFPGKDGKEKIIDLSSSPVIETDDGTKILILSGENVNEQLLKSVQAYWDDLKIQMMTETLDQIKDTAIKNVPQKPSKATENKRLVEAFLYQAGHDYIPNAKIPFVLNKIQLEASFGRILREDAADLLVNFGNVYGTALDVLEKKEFEIIAILPEFPPIEVAKVLFSNLGYNTWVNPSFFTGEMVETISGLYATNEFDKLFVPTKPLTNNAATYLKKEDVQILSIKHQTPVEPAKEFLE